MEIPDRLSVDKASPYFNHEACTKVEVFFDGVRQMNTYEYCISEGWIIRQKRTALGKIMFTQDGSMILNKLFGKVEITLKQ